MVVSAVSWPSDNEPAAAIAAESTALCNTVRRWYITPVSTAIATKASMTTMMNAERTTMLPRRCDRSEIADREEFLTWPTS